MKAAEILGKFQQAQAAKGQYAYFTLLFFMPDICGAIQYINSSFPGTIQQSLLSNMVEKGYAALGVIGVPTYDALKVGQKPYIEQWLKDDWVTGHLKKSAEQCVWLVEHNPPKSK